MKTGNDAATATPATEKKSDNSGIHTKSTINHKAQKSKSNTHVSAKNVLKKIIKDEALREKIIKETDTQTYNAFTVADVPNNYDKNIPKDAAAQIAHHTGDLGFSSDVIGSITTLQLLKNLEKGVSLKSIKNYFGKDPIQKATKKATEIGKLLRGTFTIVGNTCNTTTAGMLSDSVPCLSLIICALEAAHAIMETNKENSDAWKEAYAFWSVAKVGFAAMQCTPLYPIGAIGLFTMNSLEFGGRIAHHHYKKWDEKRKFIKKKKYAEKLEQWTAYFAPRGPNKESALRVYSKYSKQNEKDKLLEELESIATAYENTNCSFVVNYRNTDVYFGNRYVKPKDTDKTFVYSNTPKHALAAVDRRISNGKLVPTELDHPIDKIQRDIIAKSYKGIPPVLVCNENSACRIPNIIQVGSEGKKAIVYTDKNNQLFSHNFSQPIALNMAIQDSELKDLNDKNKNFQMLGKYAGWPAGFTIEHKDIRVRFKDIKDLKTILKRNVIRIPDKEYLLYNKGKLQDLRNTSLHAKRAHDIYTKKDRKLLRSKYKPNKLKTVPELENFINSLSDRCRRYFKNKFAITEEKPIQLPIKLECDFQGFTEKEQKKILETIEKECGKYAYEWPWGYSFKVNGIDLSFHTITEAKRLLNMDEKFKEIYMEKFDFKPDQPIRLVKGKEFDNYYNAENKNSADREEFCDALGKRNSTLCGIYSGWPGGFVTDVKGKDCIFVSADDLNNQSRRAKNVNDKEKEDENHDQNSVHQDNNQLLSKHRDKKSNPYNLFQSHHNNNNIDNIDNIDNIAFTDSVDDDKPNNDVEKNQLVA